mgnify:CR=1 FL=1
MRYKILLVGCGQLGSRYLQGLKKLNLPLKIIVLDKNKKSLINGEAMWNSINEKYDHQIIFKTKKPLNIKIFELCIVSTTSENRFKLIKDLNNQYRINSWIIEKIIEQNPRLIKNISKLIDNSKAWVNTPHRTSQWLSKIKKNSYKNTKNAKIWGSNYGLITNAIHYLDLFTWWTKEKIEFIDTSELNVNWHESKRAGFLETNGTLTAHYSNNYKIQIRCNDNHKNNIVVKLKLDEWTIDEIKGIAVNKNNKKIFGRIKYQSEITSNIVKNILIKGNCKLPTYLESAEIHYVYLAALLKKYNLDNKSSLKKITIT